MDFADSFNDMDASQPASSGAGSGIGRRVNDLVTFMFSCGPSMMMFAMGAITVAIRAKKAFFEPDAEQYKLTLQSKIMWIATAVLTMIIGTIVVAGVCSFLSSALAFPFVCCSFCMFYCENKGDVDDLIWSDGA